MFLEPINVFVCVCMSEREHVFVCGYVCTRACMFEDNMYGYGSMSESVCVCGLVTPMSV